tara:strand:+ start:1789 stop:2475 length:687 start_codon:yes stop_codon:yes gene_type:complete
LDRIKQGVLITFDNEMPPMKYYKKVLSKDMFVDRTELFNKVADDILHDFVEHGYAIYRKHSKEKVITANVKIPRITRTYTEEHGYDRIKEWVKEERVFYKEPAWLMNHINWLSNWGEVLATSAFNYVFKSKIKGYFFIRGGKRSWHTASTLRGIYNDYKVCAFNKHVKAAPILNVCGHVELDWMDVKDYYYDLERKAEELKYGDDVIVGGYIKVKDIGRYEAELIIGK